MRIFAATLALLAAPLPAQTIAITGGTVALGDGSAPIERGTVVVRDGRIVAAGAGVAVPVGAERVDASGKWVTPGIVAGFGRVGLVEVDGVEATNDANVDDTPFNAAIDVAPAVNPRAFAIQVSRAAGITRAIVAPETGKSMFAGQGAVIDLGADTDPITRGQAFQFVEFGETGANRAGGSRAAAHVAFRNALAEARDLRLGRRGDDALLTRADAAALAPVIDGRMPLLIHVERASDILQMIALGREFPQLRLVLVGVSEGWMVADQLARARIPVIASALNDLPGSFESLAATQSNIGRMHAKGVTVAIGMIDDDDARMARTTAQYAGNLVALQKMPGAAGLSWGEALAAITSRPAQAIGMGGELGQLKAGLRADVVMWDGDPLEPSSAPLLVLVDGVRQPLDTRQTRLRDRYRSLAPAARPEAYER